MPAERAQRRFDRTRDQGDQPPARFRARPRSAQRPNAPRPQMTHFTLLQRTRQRRIHRRGGETSEPPDRAGLSPGEQRAPEIVEESLHDRDALRISRPWALQPLTQHKQRLATAQKLGPPYRPRAHAQRRHPRLGLPDRQTKAAGETATIPRPHQLGRSKRQFRARPRVSAPRESQIKNVAADRHPQPQPHRQDPGPPRHEQSHAPSPSAAGNSRPDRSSGRSVRSVYLPSQRSTTHRRPDFPAHLRESIPALELRRLSSALDRRAPVSRGVANHAGPYVALKACELHVDSLFA